MGLSNALRVCLADEEHLANAAKDFSGFRADVVCYVEWLGSQSNWLSEIHESQPSCVTLMHLTHTCVSDLLNRLLTGVPDRDRNIVTMRFGLAQGRKYTLQEVADVYRVTRERVRQICAKAIRSFQQVFSCDEMLSAFVYYCGQIVEESQIIRPVDLVAEIAEQIRIDVDQPAFAVSFLLEVSQTARWCKSLNLLISPSMSKYTPEIIIASVREQLSQAKAPMRLGKLVKGLRGLSRSERLLFEKRDLVRKCLEATSDIINFEEDYWGLLSWENRILDDIVMAMRKLDRPAHFTEITDLVNLRMSDGQRTGPQAVYTKLSHHTKLFVRTGPGTFTLRELQPDLPAQPPKFVDLIEQTLQEAEQPITVDEISKRVNQRREIKLATLKMYLSLNERFCSFEGNTFGLAQWRKSDISITNDSGDPSPALPHDFLEHLKSRTLDAFENDIG